MNNKLFPTASNTLASPKSSSESPIGVHTLPDEQLKEMLRPGREFESKLESMLGQLPMGTTHLILVNINDYSIAPRALLHYFQSQKMPGVYVTTNRPYADLLKAIPNAPTNVHYVDTITALTGRETPDAASVTYLDSPLALVELNMAIAEKLKGVVANQKFLVLDSISTLLVYNAPQSVEKFCHTVIAKNRQENTLALFLMIESDEHRTVVETLSQFVDNVVSIR